MCQGIFVLAPGFFDGRGAGPGFKGWWPAAVWILSSTTCARTTGGGCAKYLEGVATGDATFETGAPSWESWTATHHAFARLVAREGDTFSLGGARPVSGRAV